MKDNLEMNFEIGNKLKSLHITCPNEDDEICLTIKTKGRPTNVTLTLDEAMQVQDFLYRHIKNAIQSNG